jgi:N-acyl-D-aspartate/D-glutamate deacylase
VLGHYVRDEHVLTLEQGVHKMTGMPAARLGLADHGCLHAGCVADIAIFDAAKIRDAGTFEDPHHYAEGIPFVIVNGVAVVDGGKFTAARPGKVLRHRSSTAR